MEIQWMSEWSYLLIWTPFYAGDASLDVSTNSDVVGVDIDH